MTHGDISNQGGKIIAFRFEDFLSKKKTGILPKITSFFDKTAGYDLDDKVLSEMSFIYLRTDYNTALVCEKETYDKFPSDYWCNFPYSSFVVIIEKESQITARLLTGELTYYVDDRQDRLSLVNSKYAIPLNRLRSVI